MASKKLGEDELLHELASLVADTGPCANLPALAAAACRTKAERWLLGEVLAASLVGPVADALGYLVGSDCVAPQLADWAEAFAAELPIPWDLTAVDFTAAASERSLGPARVALHEAVVTATSDACERRAVDLARDGLIGLPSWSTADLQALSGTPELREKLAGWFLSGLAERVSQLLRGCGLLLQWRAVLVPDEEPPTLSRMTGIVIAVSSVASECVAATTRFATDPSALRCFYSGRSPSPSDTVVARERLSALVVAAFDAAFRRVEGANPSLQLRPLWRLAAAELIWGFWAESQGLMITPTLAIAANFADRVVAPLLSPSSGSGAAEPKRSSRRNRRAKAKGTADTAGIGEIPECLEAAVEQLEEDEAKPALEASEDAGSLHGFALEADLHDWNRRSIEMMIRMGWSMDEAGLS